MNKVNVLLLITMLTVTSLLSGCSNYSASHEYYKARPEAKLEVPPGLDRPFEKTDMAIPATRTTSTTYLGYSGGCTEDRETLKLAPIEHLTVKREGVFIWLSANANPELLWEPTLNFLSGKGFTLAMKNDTLGIIETAWYEYQEDGLTLRDKYRLRFEFGKSPGSSEIYLSLRNELLADQWQQRTVDPELEVEMLKRLALHLGDSDVTFEEIAVEDTKVSLHERGKEGGLSLVLNHDFSEAWRRVIKVIEDKGDLVEERSVNQRFLIANFAAVTESDKARKNSWMGKMLMPSDKHAAGRFRVEFFKLESSVTEVQIQNLQGKVTNSKRAKQVMQTLEQALAEL